MALQLAALLYGLQAYRHNPSPIYAVEIEKVLRLHLTGPLLEMVLKELHSVSSLAANELTIYNILLDAVSTSVPVETLMEATEIKSSIELRKVCCGLCLKTGEGVDFIHHDDGIVHVALLSRRPIPPPVY